ncbi:MAG TPA: penicillin-binding transpeptidase domain-containing protein, partial [Steroidobacteraceae bacterium]|nr:penicillin-binding transpeptidase domain-containing protein [Steroidobacteraceae bacterium]
AVRAVLDARGEPLQAFPLEVTPAADPDVVYQLNRMLVEVVERGSGRAARGILPAGLVVAGKTGTSSDYRDSWFAGFSGQHLAVVWVGYDDNESTALTGARGALPIWARLMAGIETTPLRQTLPEGFDEVSIDFASGLRADGRCSDDPMLVAVPRGTSVPVKPGCESGFFEGLGERTKRFLDGIIR